MGTRRATALLIGGLALTALGVAGWTFTSTVADADRLGAAGSALYETHSVQSALDAQIRTAIIAAAPAAARDGAALDRTVNTARHDPALAIAFETAWRTWVQARAEGTASITLDAAAVGAVARQALLATYPSLPVGPFEVNAVIHPEVQPDPYVASRWVRVPAVFAFGAGVVLVLLGFSMAPSHSAASARIARWMIGTSLIVLAAALALPVALTWGGDGLEVVGALLAGTMDTAITPALVILGAGLLIFLVSHVRQRHEEARVLTPVSPLGRPNAATRA